MLPLPKLPAALTASIGVVFGSMLALSPTTVQAQAVVNTVRLGDCDELTGVCLANPTQRYQHGVFGDKFEYGTVMTVDEKGSAIQTYNLPYEQVFEDRRVRVTDLDDDGNPEVILIVTDRALGASVALYAYDKGDEDGFGPTVFPMAQSEYIGRTSRWLNPLDGAVDLDGDGSREIAVIETPHINPTLRIHQWNGSRLDEIARIRLAEHSNHRMGTKDLAGSLFCNAFETGKAVIQIPAWRSGEPGVFIYDHETGGLSETNLQPTDRYNPDFFDQHVACADLATQLQ